MELKQLWKVVVRGWWLLLLPPLIVGAYSLATYHRPAPTYGLSLRYTAGQPTGPAAPSGYDPNYYRWLTSEYLVGGLKDWVRTGSFAQAVSAELTRQGTPLPAADVAGAIVASDNARSILVVSLSGGDPEQVRHIALAVTAVLQTQNAAAFPQLGGQTAAVAPLDSVGDNVPAAGPPPLRAQLDLPLRLLLALAAGLALALAAHYLDPRVRDAADLEAAGLAVLAKIPRAPSNRRRS